MLALVSEEQQKRRRRRAPVTESPSAGEAGPHEGAPSDEGTAAAHQPPADVLVRPPSGPLHRYRVDPAVGLGVFVPGLFVMALGGAATWHWVFNVGEAIMLAGMTLFVGAVILTALQQRDLRKAAAGGARVPPEREHAAAPAEAATAEG
jgi:hypothetical protein